MLRWALSIPVKQINVKISIEKRFIYILICKYLIIEDFFLSKYIAQVPVYECFFFLFNILALLVSNSLQYFNMYSYKYMKGFLKINGRFIHKTVSKKKLQES